MNHRDRIFHTVLYIGDVRVLAGRRKGVTR